MPLVVPLALFIALIWPGPLEASQDFACSGPLKAFRKTGKKAAVLIEREQFALVSGAPSDQVFFGDSAVDYLVSVRPWAGLQYEVNPKYKSVVKVATDQQNFFDVTAGTGASALTKRCKLDYL
ncbi:MAG TPA: hypothetical protein VFV50_05415 [Bdellovibrionales bacterium]|nr:hypothetical protein [Bdellovibrionales bacterium]